MRMDQDDSDLLSEEDLDEEAFEGDTWIEELECALLADCDHATLKKICEGKRIPSSLRPDYWKVLLALNDASTAKLTTELDLSNQADVQRDCKKLVEEISSESQCEGGLSDPDKVQLRNNFESTLTTYVKARPELNYISGNGWTEILRVLYHLELSDSLLYQMFLRIVYRYIPKDLSTAQETSSKQQLITKQEMSKVDPAASTPQPPSNDRFEPKTMLNKNRQSPKSVQAYHLLRLLIQYHDPELCSILDSRKVVPSLYVKDWFCSLFARSCSPGLALLIWDTHFKMADPFLIFFAAIVMVVNASDELKKGSKSQAEMLQVLKSMPGQLVEDDIEDLYYLVSSHYTYSTPRSIRSYSHLFFMDTFGNTYMGNESPQDGGGSSMLDLKTIQLTSKLDLSQYLCLPVVPAEIFAIDTTSQRSIQNQSPTITPLKYFLVDCRPAEQYNAGHLNRAFHLDCSLMLREPSSFATAVQALLEIQRQIVATKSDTGGQHLCFIGSGHEEEDRYVNMVVASFLQKYQKYVSIVVGGFEAIHDYALTRGELKDSFDKYIVDHNEQHCKVCCLKTPGGIEGLRSAKPTNSSLMHEVGSGLSSAQSLLASTTSFLRGDKGVSFSKFASSPPTNLLGPTGASMLDKFTSAFVSKSSELKDKLVESLNTGAIPAAAVGLSAGYSPSTSRDHVSSADKSSRRYMGSSKDFSETRYAIDDTELMGGSTDDDVIGGTSRIRTLDLNCQKASSSDAHLEELNSHGTVEEVQIDNWKQKTKPSAFYKCYQLKGTTKYPGYIALTTTHLIILREIPHNKGFAVLAAQRPLDMIVQITSKRRQPDLIIFRYGYTSHQTKTHAIDPSQSNFVKDDQRTNSGIDSDTSLPNIVATDHLHIPQAFELIRLIKREVVRIMDESSRKQLTTNKSSESDNVEKREDQTVDVVETNSEVDNSDETNVSSNEAVLATENSRVEAKKE